jgi:hypothetical protein
VFSRWKLLVPILLIMALALWLRTATLGDQSYWFDEAQWVSKMVATPGLAAWLKQSDDANRDMVPLYFILQFGWYHHLFGTIESMRWLSVLFGMLVVLLTYQFGRELYGEQAGLLAALCCALSPLQIYYSQELRPYGLEAFLGLLAVYALYEALYRGGTRWWALNIVANSLLMWTHLFGLWLVVTEGLFLLFFHFRPFRRLLWWGVVNAALMIPVLLLVLTWKSPGDPPLGAHWLEVLSTWLCMDGFYLVLSVYYRTLSVPRDLFAGLPGFLPAAFPWIVAAFSLSLLGGVLLAILRARRSWRENTSSSCIPSLAGERNTVFFLWMWFALPALWILLFSVLVVPAFQLRYAIYSSPALYILAAAGLTGFSRRWIRYGAGALLIASMGVAAYLEITLPVRPDYMGAARYVQAQAEDGERVLWQPDLTRDTFDFNLDPRLPRIVPVGQARLRDEFEALEAALENGDGIWVLHGLWNADSAGVRAAALERYLEFRNIAYTKRMFLGRFDIAAYYCTRSPEYRSLTNPEELSRIKESITSFCPDDAPMRWIVRQALEKAGRLTEAADLCRRELEAIPAGGPEAAVLETKLWRIDWKDNQYEDAYLDLYVADLVGDLENLLQGMRAPADYRVGGSGSGAAGPRPPTSLLK